MWFAEIKQLRYLILGELLLLGIFGFLGIIPLLSIVAFILVVGVSFFIVENPNIGIHILLFSIIVDALFLTRTITSGPSILIEEVVSVLFFSLFFLKYLFSLNYDIKFPTFIIVWLPFLIWSWLGLFVAIDKFRVIAYWKNYFAGFFTFCLAYHTITKPQHIKSFLIGIVLWGLSLALIEFKVIAELGGFEIGIVGLFLKKNLLAIVWGKSNYIAAFFVLIIPIGIGTVIYFKSRLIRILIMIAITVMAFGLILTLSRGGILALLVALFILLSKVLKTKTFIPILVATLLIATVVALNPLTTVLIDRMSSVETSSSYFSRLNYYQDVWNTFLKNPITGVGFGNLGHYSVFKLSEKDSPSAHNIILGILGETGIVGAIFYFSIFFILWKYLFTLYRNEKNESLKFLRWCFISALIGGFIHALMEPTFEGFQYSIIYWSIAGSYLKLNLLNVNKSYNC